MKRGAFYLLFLIAAYIYCVVLSLGTFADDPGVGWHLATGQKIFLEHAIPHIDPFLAVARTWISDQWLSDLILYLVYWVGSWPLLYAVLVSVYLAVFFLVLYCSGRSSGISQVSLLLSAACMAKLGTVHLILRPVLFSFLFFAILYGTFSWVIRSGRVQEPISKRCIALLALLFLFWANVHPSFILGFFLISLLIASIIFEKFFMQIDFGSKVTHRLLLAMGTAAICTVLNPYGIALHKSILWLSENTFFMRLHEEWKPLSIDSGEGGHYCFVIFSVLAGIFLKGRQKIPLFEMICFLVFGYLALNSVRFLPYFAIVSVPLFASVLESIGTFHDASQSVYPEKVIFISFCLFLCTWIGIGSNLPLYNGSFGPSPSVYPYEAVEMLLKKFPEKKSITVFNHSNYGGFLTWQGKGRIKPFLDDRNTLSGEEPYRKLMAAMRKDSKLKDFSKDYDAVLVRNSDLDKQCNPLEDLNVLFSNAASTLATN